MMDVSEILPPAFSEPWSSLRAQTVDAPDRLSVCLIGEFSVGKSSLTNMLLGRPLLATGLSETTAIPTFVERGEDWSCILGSDGQGKEVSPEELRGAVSSLPETEAEQRIAVVTAPLEWLEGISLVDLPGTGGVDERRQSFTRAQLRAADAVIYLLPPRGPSAQDREWLGLITSMGKPVHVLVHQWDVALASERVPSLGDWEADLAKVVGGSVRLGTSSVNGLGRDELLAVLARLGAERVAIRKARLVREGGRLLDAAVATLTSERQAAEATSVEAVESVRGELRERRRSLLSLQQTVLERRRHSRDALHTTFERLVADAPKRLDEDARALSTEHLAGTASEASWKAFVAAANQAAERRLAELAKDLSRELSHEVDTTQLVTTWSPLAVAFPSPPSLDADSLRRAGQANQVEERLIQLAALLDRAPERALPQATPQEIVLLREELANLRRGHAEVLGEDVPMLESGPGPGKIIGRMLGEAADLALIFVNPATVAAKAGPTVVKAAKALGLGMKKAKAIKYAHQGVMAVQAGMRAAKGDAGAQKKSTFAKIADALGFLDYFTVAYWGERVGSWIDGPPELRPDPEALAARDARVQELTRAMDECRRSIFDVERKLERTDQSAFERQLLERERSRLVASLERSRAEEESAERERLVWLEAQVRAQGDALRGQLVAALGRQAFAMRRVVVTSFSNFWEGEMSTALAGAEAQVQALERRLETSPADRTRILAELDARIAALVGARATLR